MSDKSVKVLAVTADHPFLLEMVSKISQERDALVEQMKFFEKRAKSLAEDHSKKKKQFWREIEAYLKSIGTLPENYKHWEDGGSNFIQVEGENQDVFWLMEKGKDGDFPEALKKILGGMIVQINKED